jgi:hypothetical protein
LKVSRLDLVWRTLPLTLGVFVVTASVSTAGLVESTC